MDTTSSGVPVLSRKSAWIYTIAFFVIAAAAGTVYQMRTNKSGASFLTNATAAAVTPTPSSSATPPPFTTSSIMGNLAVTGDLTTSGVTRGGRVPVKDVASIPCKTTPNTTTLTDGGIVLENSDGCNQAVILPKLSPSTAGMTITVRNAGTKNQVQIFPAESNGKIDSWYYLRLQSNGAGIKAPEFVTIVSSGTSWLVIDGYQWDASTVPAK